MNKYNIPYYDVNDERTQRVKMRYLQLKDGTHRLICWTLHEHNSMIISMLNEDGSKKRMFNHINMSMKKRGERTTLSRSSMKVEIL